MKYRVTLSAKKISDPDSEIKLVAVSAENAKAIAEMRYKKYLATQAVRLDKSPSTLQTMKGLVDDFVKAMGENNRESASRIEKTFYSIISALQSEMDVVAFQMAKKCLPTLPPLGK